nr:hypothetical protein [Morchella crassipes]
MKETFDARVIEHFNNYPLKTQKYADFLLFKRAFDLLIIKNILLKQVYVNLLV